MDEKMDDWDHGYLEGLVGNPVKGEGTQYEQGWKVGQYDRLQVIAGGK